MKFENILKKGRWLRAIIETARKGPAYCPGYSMPNVLLRIFNIRNNTNIFRLPEGGCKKGYAKNVVKKKVLRKGKIFENLGKNVWNLKIFWKKAGDCVRLSKPLEKALHTVLDIQCLMFC